MKLSDFDLGWYRQWEQKRRFVEEWSRPGLTNFLGSVQIGGDVSSLRHPMFPPVSGAEESTAFLTLNGTFLPATKLETTISWTPWGIERSVTLEGVKVATRTTMPWDSTAIVMEIRLSLADGPARRCDLGLRLSGRCLNRGLDGWFWGTPKVGLVVTELHDQSGMNPVVSALENRGRLSGEKVAEGETCRAWTAQALEPAPDHTARNGDFYWDLDLNPGEDYVIHYALVMGETDQVGAQALELSKKVPALLRETENNWRNLWKSIFKGGEHFSGKLADLDLPEAIVPVAASGILSTVMLRRRHLPNNGKTRYSISMPRRVEACFYTNDWGMAGHILARLDPVATWEQLEMALLADIRKYNQINTLTGKGGDYTGHGWPYTIDIYNAFFVAWQLYQSEGDSALKRELETARGRMSLLEVLEDLAFDYRSRLNPEFGLADYGPRQELLECVSTYEHIVAGLNAAAAWMLQRVADIYSLDGGEEQACTLREESRQLVKNIQQQLYVEGQGWYRVILPNGERRECRHVWDIAMVLMCIGEQLPAQVQDEIVGFFQAELQTPTWVRALSPHDADSAVSGVRADHQFNGAFGSWPAEMLLGLINIGRRDIVDPWMQGIAKTARQGPFAQAYYDEGVYPEVFGAAAKVTDELPQCCHWCNLSGAMYFEVAEKLV